MRTVETSRSALGITRGKIGLYFRVLATYGFWFTMMCSDLPFIISVPGQETGNNQSKFTQTDQGRLGASFIDVVNTGDKVAQQNFVASRFSESSLKNTPTDAWVDLLQKLHQQSNGFKVVSATPEGESVLNIIVRSQLGNHWARLVLISQNDKLSDIFVLPTLDPAIQEKSGFPKMKMTEGEAVKTIKRHVERLSALDQFSGVVLVAKRERILFQHAYGMAEKSFNVPNNLSTKFHLGSMDKMFTGVAIAQLVQSGRLSFSDTLAKVLPDFPNRSMAEKITIHQLLTHTAGTGDFISNPEYRAHRENYKNIRDYVPSLAKETLLFAPGSGWSYSNSGYLLLGLLIEKLSGESYFDYVAQHIFNAAAMRDTGYYELNEVVTNRATGYLRDAAEDPLGIDVRRSNVMFIGLKGNSAGGGYSTAPDLLKFSFALRRHKLLDANLTEMVTSGKIDMIGAPRPAKYAYGFASRTINGKEARGMNGGGANSGVNSSLQMFWDGSYTVVAVGNYDAPAAEDLNNAICEFLTLQ